MKKYLIAILIIFIVFIGVVLAQPGPISPFILRWLDMTDTPSSYSGQAGKYVKVNAGEDAVEFGTPAGAGTMSTVEDGDVQVGGADIAVLDFDGTVFAITESPDTEINVDVADDGIDSQHYAAASIDEEHLNITNSGTDNYVLTYNAAGSNFSWAQDQTGSGNDVYIEEGDAAKVDSTGADLYVDFDATDFDVGVVGNEANVTIPDDGHNHTGASISGVDISDDTNLAGGTGITLTDDTLSADLGTSISDAEVDNDITIDLATLATTVTITDNESTAENNPLVFVENGDLDGGNLGLESDGDVYYTPSTGIITATGFAGALTGNVTGDVSGNAGTVTNGVYTTDNLSVMAATTSAQLYGILSDETGSGAGSPLAVFNQAPTIDSPTFTTAITATDLIDSAHYVADSIDNEHVNWADIDYLTDEGAAINEAFAAGWNGDVGPPEKDDVYDYLINIDSDADGSVTDETWYTNILDGTAAFTDLNGNDILDSDNYNADSIDDEHINWGSGANQIDLADIPGGTAGANAFDFGGATSVEIPNAESADATLTALGQVHIRGDEDRFSAHLGAGGEIAGEATKSFIEYVSVRFDPGAWYDSDAELFLFTVSSKKYPNGIIIDAWSVSCNLDPDVEIDADLRYADAWIGLANAADIDEIDTTNGASSEDTDANINGGVAVAAGKVIYIGFDADPEGTATQMIYEMWFHSEED